MKCLTSVIDILGTFKPQQMIDVIGYVADNKNPTLAHLQIIHTMPIHFIGKSDPITKHRQARFNPGKHYVIGHTLHIQEVFHVFFLTDLKMPLLLYSRYT